MEKYFNTLEFTTIRRQLAELCLTDWAENEALTLVPCETVRAADRMLEHTTAARELLERLGTPPLTALEGFRELLDLAGKGSMLSPDDLLRVDSLAAAVERMRRYLLRASDNPVGAMGASLIETPMLRDEIARCIRAGQVADDASPTLRDLRRKTANLETQLHARCDSLLRGHPEWFSDSMAVTRAGRVTLPVKREFRKRVEGSAVDQSGTGATVFVEPAAVRRLAEELDTLEIEADNEIRRVLYELSGLVADEADTLRRNTEGMETLDWHFARGKLSLAMQASPVHVRSGGEIDLRDARHPLLDPRTAVPLTLRFGHSIRGVVVTGPNTGGKTVALKTVGLLTLMASAGLHVPAAPDSVLPLPDAVFADIGDGQSVTECLSTFSSHITNVVSILSGLTENSLVLLDELGSGTDPAEGMGLAVATLEALRKSGCMFLVTTHYPEVKEYADRPGMVNARMAFDRETLRPLYRLEVGQAGESCALYIARRLGYPAELLELARDASEGKMPAADALPIRPAPATEKPVSPEEPAVSEEKSSHAASFGRGDAVLVYPGRERGIVSKPADERGNLEVYVRREPRMVNHKRLKLIAKAEMMYPEDYDFSIVFDTVSNRKARHEMERKRTDAVIVHRVGNEPSAPGSDPTR